MDLIVAIGIALVLAGAIMIALGRLPTPTHRAPRPWRAPPPAGATVRLDVSADADEGALRRLVADAAQRALEADPSLTRVEVVDRDGRLLERVLRPEPLAAPPRLPPALQEPHRRPDRTPRVVRADHADLPATMPRADEAPPSTTFAERFELPAGVRAGLRDPDRPAELVRALLAAAGHEAHLDGDLVRTADTAVVVVPGRRVDRELANAFVRIQASGASRGLVIRLGYADPAALRRREAAAPHVRHVGPEAFQRMADAVATGADPLAFAAAPVTLR